MDIFPLRYPGSHLDGLVPNQAHQVQSLLYVLESHIGDAAIGLALFLESRVRRPPQRDPIAEAPWEARRRQLEHQAEGALPGNLSAQDRWIAHARIRDEVAQRLTLERAEAGQLPRSYAHRLPFIHAHTVVYALDGVGKTLGVLARESYLPRTVDQAHVNYQARLPGLTPVRDSAHHLEDRGRGLGKGGKQLQLQPITTEAIHAPGGGVLVLDSLENDDLCFTGSDGAYHRVEISATSVRIAQEGVQQVLDVLPWQGPPRSVP